MIDAQISGRDMNTYIVQQNIDDLTKVPNDNRINL
jgi:hypothetical protein